MQNAKTLEARAAARRLDSGRRASRGLVASYIHALSARHAAASPPRRERSTSPRLAPARSG